MIGVADACEIVDLRLIVLVVERYKFKVIGVGRVSEAYFAEEKITNNERRVGS